MTNAIRPTAPWPAAMGRRILLATAAIEWGSSATSENNMMFEIVRELAGNGHQFIAVAERFRGTSPCPTVLVGRRRLDSLGGLTLPFRTATAVRRGRLLEGADLAQHAFPFAVGRTFSILPLMLQHRDVPFVIGPVQTPQTQIWPDEASNSLAERPLLMWVDRSAEQLARGPVRHLLRSLSVATLRAASAVVAMTRAARGLLLQHSVTDERITVIPPPVGAEFFRSHVEDGDGSRLRFVTAGWLIERKGVEEVLRAFAGIRRRGIDAQLVIAGDGPRRALLEAEAGSLGVRDAVVFAGWLGRAELADLLASADILVSMSRSESWGLTLGEAMACGAPVVSADNVGAREQIREGENGLLVPIGDAGACEARLFQLCQEPQLRVHLARSGRRWVEETLHPRAVSARWAELYDDVLAARRPRSVVHVVPDEP